MKKLHLLYLIVFAFTACGEKSTTEDATTETESYKLTAMSSGQMAGAKEDSLQWEEVYIFGADFSFEKIRVRNGETMSASGNYKRTILDDGEYFILDYESAHPIIGNCTSDYTETLRIIDETKLQGTWLACDGPALTYTLERK